MIPGVYKAFARLAEGAQYWYYLSNDKTPKRLVV